MKFKFGYVVSTLMLTLTACQLHDPGYDYSIFDETPVELLARAVENDQSDEITKLVKMQKMDVNFQDGRYGSSVLKLAVVNQQPMTVETLLKVGANANLVGGFNRKTPFINALEYSFRDCDPTRIRILIKYGADVNTIQYDTLKNERGVSNNQVNTALMIAAREGCLNVVKALVENGADINKCPREYGYGAISEALIHDNVDIAKYLIVDKKAIIPDYVLVRLANRNFEGEPEEKVTVTQLLLESDYSAQPENQRAKEAILAYLEKIGKK